MLRRGLEDGVQRDGGWFAVRWRMLCRGPTDGGARGHWQMACREPPDAVLCVAERQQMLRRVLAGGLWRAGGQMACREPTDVAREAGGW